MGDPKMQALVEALKSPAIDRVLERARDRAEEAVPRREESAADPSLVYRAHYAQMAEQAREEVAAIDALRAALDAAKQAAEKAAGR